MTLDTRAGSDRSTPLAPRVRVVFRESSGAVHLDWPFGRVESAIHDKEGTLWIDIDDRDLDLTAVEELFRNVFHFHPLAIEDALQESNVPKLDNWGKLSLPGVPLH